MRAILRRENWWTLTEAAFTPDAFPANLGTRMFTEAQLESVKANACTALVLSVSDDLVDTIAAFTDPAVAWQALKNAYQSGDQSQVLTLTSQLHSIKLSEGGSIEDYIKKTREIRNRLTSMGETISDKTMIQIVLNGLPRSYESTIQTLTHLNVDRSFEQVSSSLLTESHRRKHRAHQLGNDEALAATFHHKASLHRNIYYQRGRGGRGPS